jgi:hypothetical protein
VNEPMQHSLPALHRLRIEAHHSGDLFVKLTDNSRLLLTCTNPRCAQRRRLDSSPEFTLSPSVSLGKRSRRARGNSKRYEQERVKC